MRIWFYRKDLKIITILTKSKMQTNEWFTKEELKHIEESRTVAKWYLYDIRNNYERTKNTYKKSTSTRPNRGYYRNW